MSLVVVDGDLLAVGSCRPLILLPSSIISHLYLSFDSGRSSFSSARSSSLSYDQHVPALCASDFCTEPIGNLIGYFVQRSSPRIIDTIRISLTQSRITFHLVYNTKLLGSLGIAIRSRYTTTRKANPSDHLSVVHPLGFVSQKPFNLFRPTYKHHHRSFGPVQSSAVSIADALFNNSRPLHIFSRQGFASFRSASFHHTSSAISVSSGSFDQSWRHLSSLPIQRCRRRSRSRATLAFSSQQPPTPLSIFERTVRLKHPPSNCVLDSSTVVHLSN